MKRVFVDTGGFVALLVAEDKMHPRASTLFDSAARDHWSLVTTNAVVVETYSVRDGTIRRTRLDLQWAPQVRIPKQTCRWSQWGGPAAPTQLSAQTAMACAKNLPRGRDRK